MNAVAQRLLADWRQTYAPADMVCQTPHVIKDQRSQTFTFSTLEMSGHALLSLTT
jgi:hypothetical protein